MKVHLDGFTELYGNLNEKFSQEVDAKNKIEDQYKILQRNIDEMTGKYEELQKKDMEKISELEMCNIDCVPVCSQKWHM